MKVDVAREDTAVADANFPITSVLFHIDSDLHYSTP